MPRKPRVQFPNAIYHVITRGDGRKPIFHDDDHYQRLTDGLAEEVERSGWIIPAFCWMPNHIHLLVQTPIPNLSRGMQHWLSGYANWYAKRNRRTGHLYQGRFQALHVEDESYFWALSRYIHLNPIKCKQPLVQKLTDWKHSSFPGYARKKEQLAFVDYHAIWDSWTGEFGGKDPQKSYRKFVTQATQEHETISDPLGSALDNWVLGSKKFLKKIVSLAEKEQPAKRLLRRSNVVDPVMILSIVAKSFGVKKEDYQTFRSHAPGREAAALLCRRLTPITLSELSKLLGLRHKDSSANLVKKAKRLRLETESKSFEQKLQKLKKLILKTENQV